MSLIGAQRTWAGVFIWARHVIEQAAGSLEDIFIRLSSSSLPAAGYIVAPPLLRLGREDSLCLISGALESIHFQFFLSLWDVSEQGKIE